MVSIYGVLEKWAAKQEQAPKQEAPETAENGAPSVQTRRYYFYEAPPENSIKFTALNQILSKESPEKEATIKKLEGGNTGPKFADYFVWKAVAIRTNKYDPSGRTFVTYISKLNPFGGKVQGSETIAPQDAAVTPETVEKDFLFFDDKAGNSSIINVDKTGESLYIDRDAPQDAAALISKNVVPAGNKQPYEEFVKKFDEYRVWIPNMRQLMLPDFEKPTHDNLKSGYGHYVGGEQAFKENVAPYVKEEGAEDEEPSLKNKLEEGKDKAPAFRPGTKPVAPTEGEMVDSGDSALKDAYNLREAARRVLAIITSAPSTSTSTSTSTITGQKKPNVPISPDSKTNQQSAKMLQDLAKMQEKMKQTEQTVMRQMGTQTVP